VNPERWQQIKAALHAALELAPERRPAYIDRIAANDSQLRGELESLLAAHDQASDTFLNTPAAGLEAFRALDGPDPWIGKHIGPYQLTEQIGSGGMGEVYRAIRADDEYQKQVAIKLIRAGQDSAHVVQRFRNERQILASFDHPNIARLLDGGTTREGLPYFVMELIEGESIDSYCDRRKLDITARLRLFLQVCGAVQYAHQRLIIHRDLKPNNILVGADGVPKLLDFGIAKILEPGAALGQAHDTKSVFRLLTPDYASPEQVRGEPITTASDVYSLGLVLYELLTGLKPCDTAGRTALTLPSTVQDWEPRRPSSAVRRRSARSAAGGFGYSAGPETRSAAREGSPQRLSRRLRGDLDNIVLMALRTKPARRYDSVERFADDLRRHLSSHPVMARPDTLGYRAVKFTARYRAGVTVAGVLALGLLAGLVLTAREARIAENQRQRAEHRFDDVRRLAHSLIFEIDDSIQNLSGSSEARHLIVTTGLQYLNDLSTETAGDSSLQREVAAGYERLGDVQGRALGASQGNYAGAADSYRRALALRRSIVVAQPGNSDARRELVSNCIKLSELLFLTGNAADILAFSREAVTNSSSLVAGDPGNRQYQSLAARSLLSYGYQLFKIKDDVAAALVNIRQSLGLYVSLWAADTSDPAIGRALSLAYTRAGEVLSQDAQSYRQALSMDRSAHELLQKLADAAPNNVDLAHLLAFSDWDIAGILIDMGDLEGASQHANAALRVLQGLSAADPKVAEYHADVALVLQSLARIADDRGQTAEAVSLAQRALPESAAALAAGATNGYFRYVQASIQAELGDAYATLGANPRLGRSQRAQDWRSAGDWYGQALNIYQVLGARYGESAAEARRIRKQIETGDEALTALGAHDR
jgi:non-specific serine/threonine protein kinase/serine/threonine-protein kinase